MSFDSYHRTDSTSATSGVRAEASADRGEGRDQNSQPTMAKKSNTTEKPATESVIVAPTTLAQHDTAVKKAERAFLSAVDAGGDGVAERLALKAAKDARAAFAGDRLPIAARSYLESLSTNDGEKIKAAITELRSALSGIAKPATVAPSTPEA